MAAPTLQAQGAIAAVTTGNLTVILPAHQTDDILLVAIAVWIPNTAGDALTPPVPAGWTEITEAGLGAVQIDGFLQWVWKRAASGAEADPVFVRQTGWDTGADTNWSGRAYVIRGCITTGDPWDFFSMAGPYGTASQVFNPVTVSGIERMVVHFFNSTDNQAAGAAPTGWTAGTAVTTATGTDAGFQTFRKDNVSANTSGDASNAAAPAAGGYGFLGVSFKPPAATIVISAAGAIASAEAFGTQKANLALLSVGALASGELFGTTVVIGPQTVGPAGAIASAETFGTLKEILSLGPAGAIASAQAFGTTRLNLALLLAGIASAEAIGALTVIIDQTVGPAGAIASAQAFGSSRMVLQLVPAGIASGQAFGSAQLALEILPVSIASGEALGAARMLLSIGPAGGIASAEALGLARLAFRLALVAIASGEAIGTLSVYGGVGQVIAPTGITSAEALGALSIFMKELIARGAVTIDLGTDERTVVFDDPDERTIADVKDTKVQG